MSEPTGRLTTADGAVLARLAVTAVDARLGARPLDGRLPASRPLRALGASFVTLECAGALRGCIGTLEPVRPLYRDVVRNAVRASNDPRLPAVTAAEWPALAVKVSVLSCAEPLLVSGPADLLAALRPGVDGLILTDGRRRATFLPTVWGKLPDPRRFLAALLDKGGWPPGAWPPGLTAQRYTAQEYQAQTHPTPLPASIDHASVVPSKRCKAV
jgi:AmmeMemoRadiSam system protein A